MTIEDVGTDDEDMRGNGFFQQEELVDSPLPPGFTQGAGGGGTPPSQDNTMDTDEEATRNQGTPEKEKKKNQKPDRSEGSECLSVASRRGPRSNRNRKRGKGNKKKPEVRGLKPQVVHRMSSVYDSMEQRRQEAGIQGIFKKEEEGVIVHNFGPTSRDKLDTDAAMMEADVDTVYKRPIPLSQISDEFKADVKGKTIEGGASSPS